MEKEKDKPDVTHLLTEYSDKVGALGLHVGAEFLVNEQGAEKILRIEQYGKNRILTKQEYEYRKKVQDLADFLSEFTSEELELAQQLNRSLEEFNI